MHLQPEEFVCFLQQYTVYDPLTKTIKLCLFSLIDATDKLLSISATSPRVLLLVQCSSTGVPQNPRVPWNMWWGSVSFKGSTRVPRLFREIDFLLQHFDA